MTRRSLPALAACATFFAVAAAPSTAIAQPVYVDQGPNWSEVPRAQFYSMDQGARMIPLAWLRALKQADGKPFLTESFARYGYLPNTLSASGLPIGFTTSGPPGAENTGMTCSACHTREITAEGKSYRIDGGPAIVDFQSLLADLDASVQRVLKQPALFKEFAAAVLGPNPSKDAAAQLLLDVNAWALRFHTLTTRALPQDKPWGYARLDAVGMIFNRLAGLDVGPPPSYIIASNIKKADAPVRYPFLWNAAYQNKTQWPGFADNGNDVLGLARNVGEVVGVFGVYQPKRDGLFVNFMHNNSVNFENLWALENLIKIIGPPKWPWDVRPDKARDGKIVYDLPTASGGCVECHATRAPAERYTAPAKPFPTPVMDVKTDTREYNVLGWTAKTGALQGAFIPFVTKPLKSEDLVINMLKTSVIGMIGESFLVSRSSAQSQTAQIAQPNARLQSFAAKTAPPKALPPELSDLPRAFAVPQRAALKAAKQDATGTPAAYESRVLEGIWAAAPYLHNGSVPTLADLLKPAAERPTKFRIGAAYDVVNVGIKADQGGQGSDYVATSCAQRGSGNSNCGHEYGAGLSAADKENLLEYLKTL